MNIIRNALIFSFLTSLGLAATACGGSDESSGTTTAAGSAGASAGAAGAGASGAGAAGAPAGNGGQSGDAGQGGGGGSAIPDAPVMKSVSPLSGALHVVWTLPASGCDQVHLSRNKDGGPYAVAYTLPGTATSQHDVQAKAGATYCYTAACMKGEVMSPESNEKCGMP